MGVKCCNNTQNIQNEPNYTIESKIVSQYSFKNLSEKGSFFHINQESLDANSLMKKFTEKITKEEEEICKGLKPLKKKKKKKKLKKKGLNIDISKIHLEPTKKKEISESKIPNESSVPYNNKNSSRKDDSNRGFNENLVTMNIENTRRSDDEEKDIEGDQNEEGEYIQYVAENGYEFDLLNRQSDKGFQEIEVIEKKKAVAEKISLRISIEKLNFEFHSGMEFMVEVLYTTTENPQDFFTLGNTQIVKCTDKDSIKFEEDIEVDFLFERVQFLRLIIYSSDDKTSELTVNLVKVMTSNFQTVRFPVNLQKGESLLYTGNKWAKEVNQVLVMNFKRITAGIEKLYPNYLVQFNFNSASISANRLRYEILLETNDSELKLIHESNELTGKNPLCFAVSSVNKEDLFKIKDIKNYIFEFYQNDVYFGQIVLGKADMDKILTSETPIPFNVVLGRQFHVDRRKTPPTSARNLMLGKASNKYLGSVQSHKEINNVQNSSRQIRQVMSFIGSSKKLFNPSDPTEDLNLTPTGSKFTPKLLTVNYKLNLPINQINQSNQKLKDSHSPRRSSSNIVSLAFGEDVVTNREKDKIVGTASIYYFEKKKRLLHDYFFKGMRMFFEIAIDFTSSNLDPNNPDSLHTKNLENNQYVKSINCCGKVLNEYVYDRIFPVYGFGGVPESLNAVSHSFNINNTKDPNINGLDEVIRTYNNCLNSVKLVGPTYFKFILKSIQDLVKKTISEEFFSYHVFLILTDGRIDDFAETIDLIVELSKFPISIIIAGVGNADFGKMYHLGKYFNILTIFNNI